MKDVMLDFETLATGRNACIIQVGAVFFDKTTGELGQSFKFNINPASAVKSGASLDADTIMWWMKQSDEARASILHPGHDIMDVLHSLNAFLEPATRIWSHATFDFVLLTETMKRLSIKPSFSYKAGLDLRTLVYLAGTKVSKTTREGTHHDALDDCKHQVKYCVEALNAIKTNKSIVNFMERLNNEG